MIPWCHFGLSNSSLSLMNSVDSYSQQIFTYPMFKYMMSCNVLPPVLNIRPS